MQKIALAGVPNSGKTTFWNLATGKSGKTGNWPGVTCEKLSALLRLFPDTELFDIPGIYSLSGTNLEEKNAKNFLKSGEADSLIIIIDGTKPEQGLYLALELLSLGIPSVIGINFSDELHKRNIRVDTEKMSTELGVPVFMISAVRNENINALITAAKNAEKSKVFLKNLPPELRHKKSAAITKDCFSSKTTFRKKSSSLKVFVFAAVLMFLIFSFALVLKSILSLLFEHLSFFFTEISSRIHVRKALSSLFIDGFLPGLETAFSFLPELAAIFFVLSFLEDCGFLARAAFVSDFVLKKIGLSGRSIIPLLLGFGCTVSAVYATKSSDSECSKRSTLSSLMFIPCSARLPLTLLICKNIFPGLGKFAAPLFFLTVILIGAAFSFFSNRSSASDFVLEIPEVRFPSIKSTVKTTFRRLNSFISKAAATVVLTSVLIWVLKNFTLSGSFAATANQSILYSIGKLVVPVFSPCRIPFEGCIALFCGLFAKESALFALVSLSKNVSEIFSPISAVSFLLFYLIYSPCTAALAAIQHEFGAKKAIWLFLRQIAFAYFISFSFCQFAVLIKNIFSL